MSDPIQSAPMSAKREEIIEKWTGICNPMTGEQLICTTYDSEGAGYTPSDVNDILNGYYRAEAVSHKAFEKLQAQVHMSALPGCICWASLGGGENLKLEEAISDTCESDVLRGPDAEAKCDALEGAVGRYADDPWYETAGKWVGGGATALAGTWMVFGPGMTYWNKWYSGKGGPKGGASSGSGGGDGGSSVKKTPFPTGGAQRSSLPVVEPEAVTVLGVLAVIGYVILNVADKAAGFATGTFIMIDGGMIDRGMGGIDGRGGSFGRYGHDPYML
jgi:hypothetical protein